MKIMERMGWSYEELMNTPAIIIHEIELMWSIESEFSKFQVKGIKRGNRQKNS